MIMEFLFSVIGNDCPLFSSAKAYHHVLVDFPCMLFLGKSMISEKPNISCFWGMEFGCLGQSIVLELYSTGITKR